MLNVTDEIVWELQDQVQAGNRMLAALCRANGIDPEQAARMPGDAPPAPATEAA